MNRQAFILTVLIAIVLVTSCTHGLRRERLYNQNGWRIGPYEIILRPSFEVDSTGAADQSRIKGGFFEIYQIQGKLDNSNRTLPEITIKSVGILLADGIVKTVPLSAHRDSTDTGKANLISRSSFVFDWEGFQPLKDGSCVKYTLRLQDKATGEILYHARFEENFGARKWSLNYPHPFCPVPTIDFQLPLGGDYSLTIYNIKGEVVATFNGTALADELIKIDWSAEGLASGVYFYKLVAGDYSETKKLLLLK